MKVKKHILKWALLSAACIFLLAGNHAEAAESHARVLAVTRGDYNGSNDLTPGPQNDGKNFRRILGQAYKEALVKEVVKEKEGVLTVRDVKSVIQDTFRDAKEEDVNYFYYSGHGANQGLFLGGNEILTAEALAAGFEGIKGTNILVIDCCYSGGMASRSIAGRPGEEQFLDGFIEEFQTAVSKGKAQPRSALTNAKFKMLLASAAEELSWQAPIGSEAATLGGCTSTLCYGCGIDPAKVNSAGAYTLQTASADYNMDGEISLNEIRQYIENTYHYAANHVRCYPSQDDSCFMPVEEEKIPKITFEKAMPDSEGTPEIQMLFHSKAPATVDYAVYHEDSKLLGSLAYSDLHDQGKLPEYANIQRVGMRENLAINDVYEDGLLNIPADGLEAGKYYVLLQIHGQELRYLVPFSITKTENQELKKNFRILFRGDTYDSEKNIFESGDGRELTVRADFGTTTNPEEDTPYLSCDVFDAEGNHVKTLGVCEQMQLVPTEYEDGGNTLKKGNCYRDFYWDGTSDGGAVMPHGVYLIQVISRGAVSDTKVERILLGRNVKEAQFMELTLSKEEIKLPAEDGEKPVEVRFAVNMDGMVTIDVLRITGGEKKEVRRLLENVEVEGESPYILQWDGLVDGPAQAPAGSYQIRITFTPSEDAAPVTALSEMLAVKTEEKEEPHPVIPIPSGGLKAELSKDGKDTALLEYQLASSSYVYAVLCDAQGTQVAVLANGEELASGSHKLLWNGKDVKGTLVKAGIYTITLKVKDTRTGREQILLDKEAIKVTGLSDGEQGDGGHRDEDLSVLPAEVKLYANEKAVKSIKMGLKEKVQLTAEILPQNASEKTVLYVSSNTKVATVTSGGKITAKKTGKAVITVSTKNGKKAAVTVTVKKAPKKVSAAKTKTLKVGKSWKIKAKLPKKTASFKLTYSSSKKKIASVDKNGVVKARKKGRAVITVKTFNGKKAKVKIEVK